jgi:hypothetical protein
MSHLDLFKRYQANNLKVSQGELMKLALSALLLTFLNISFAQHDHMDLTNAKLAHDASHRIGRLVDTGRMDESFVSNMSALEVVALPHTDHTGPAFKVIATVGSGANQAELIFDMSGNFLTSKVTAQGPAETSPWTETAGSEIIEAALHSVMDTTDANIAAFGATLSKVSLKKMTKDDGSVEAVVLITASSTTKTLQITLSTAGAVLSTSILQ